MLMISLSKVISIKTKCKTLLPRSVSSNNLMELLQKLRMRASLNWKSKRPTSAMTLCQRAKDSQWCQRNRRLEVLWTTTSTTRGDSRSRHLLGLLNRQPELLKWHRGLPCRDIGNPVSSLHNQTKEVWAYEVAPNSGWASNRQTNSRSRARSESTWRPV